MNGIIAGIDVHKRVLMAVIGTGSEGGKPGRFERRRFGATSPEISNLSKWLTAHGVQEAVMESTAQYWKPVWLALEGRFGLHLAQAWSSRAPRGKKTGFKDAERLVRRYCAEELTLSFVPDAEQRQIRTLTRRRTQLTRDRIRIHNQVESLLEETRIKLSSVVSDLFGTSGLRILEALAGGETDAAKLAALADARLHCPAQLLTEALTGAVGAVHRLLLGQHLDHLQLVDRQIEQLSQQTAILMLASSQAIARLVDIPGIGAVAAQQIVAEAGPEASAFASAPQFSSWIGVSPGKDESAEQNQSSRCAKGNHYLRVVLCQAAQAAVRAKQSVFEQKFRRLLPRLGYTKAVWAIARHLAIVIWKVLHQGVEYVEYGMTQTPALAQRRLQRIKKQLRELGYSDELRIIQPQPLSA